MSAVVLHVFHNLSSVSQLLEPKDHIPIQDMSWLILTQPCVIIKGYTQVRDSESKARWRENQKDGRNRDKEAVGKGKESPGVK